MRISCTLWLACAIAPGAARAQDHERSPNLLPDPGFEDVSAKLWQGIPGWVVRDPGVAEQGQHSYCLKVSPERRNVHLTQQPPIALRPWSWYELAYSYRIEPPIRFTFGLCETNRKGHQFVRMRSHLGPRHPRPGQFVRTSFRFLSRHEPCAFRLYVYAACGSEHFLPGRVWLDSLSLRFIEPAPKAPPKPLKLLDASFEAPLFVSGYDPSRRCATVESGSARTGRRVLKRTDGKRRGQFSIQVVHPDQVQLGHVYRAAIWARGTGTCFVSMHVASSLFYDWDRRDAANRFPLSRTEWRQVYLDCIVDHTRLVGLGAMHVWFDGDLEFDDASLTRIR